MGSMQYIVFFVGCMVLVSVLALTNIPTEFQIMPPFSLALLAVEASSIAVGCVFLAGSACIIAFTGVSAGNILGLWLAPQSWVNIVFAVPLIFFMVWALIELARGN